MSMIIYQGLPEALDITEQILPADAQKERVDGELRVTEDDGDDTTRYLQVECIK